MADLIERSGAIDALKGMYQAAEKWGQEANTDVIKARAESCMASIVEMKLRIEKLPPAQSEQKVGKWLSQKGGGYKCSECGRYALDEIEGEYVHVAVRTPYCPYCRKKMEEYDE